MIEGDGLPIRSAECSFQRDRDVVFTISESSGSVGDYWHGRSACDKHRGFRRIAVFFGLLLLDFLKFRRLDHAIARSLLVADKTKIDETHRSARYVAHVAAGAVELVDFDGEDLLGDEVGAILKKDAIVAIEFSIVRNEAEQKREGAGAAIRATATGEGGDTVVDDDDVTRAVGGGFEAVRKLLLVHSAAALGVDGKVAQSHVDWQFILVAVETGDMGEVRERDVLGEAIWSRMGKGAQKLGEGEIDSGDTRDGTRGQGKRATRDGARWKLRMNGENGVGRIVRDAGLKDDLVRFGATDDVVGGRFSDGVLFIRENDVSVAGESAVKLFEADGPEETETLRCGIKDDDSGRIFVVTTNDDPPRSASSAVDGVSVGSNSNVDTNFCNHDDIHRFFATIIIIIIAMIFIDADISI